MRIDRAFCLSVSLTAFLGTGACATYRPPAVTTVPGEAVPPTPTPEPQVVPPPAEPKLPEAPPRPSLSVTPADQAIAVSLWSEPRQLRAGGGQAQILVRVQTRGNRPAPGIEVRLATSEGSLYSNGRLLVTDPRGMTRDRLTTHRSTRVTVNAGGVTQEIVVLVGENIVVPMTTE